MKVNESRSNLLCSFHRLTRSELINFLLAHPRSNFSCLDVLIILVMYILLNQPTTCLWLMLFTVEKEQYGTVINLVNPRDKVPHSDNNVLNNIPDAVIKLFITNNLWMKINYQLAIQIRLHGLMNRYLCVYS